MSSSFDKNLLPEFESVKDADEEILWTGKPRFIPFIFSGLGVALYTLLFGVVWIVINLNVPHKDDGMGRWFWMFGLLALAQGFFPWINRVLSYSNTIYAYSNKRVMMRTGFIGTDFKSIDYDKISDIEVTVNILERAYDVGTVRFFSGRTKTDENNTTKIYDSWIAIGDPYAAFKAVKQISVDVKTDYNYPNALRPDTNPGYRTKYNRRP